MKLKRFYGVATLVLPLIFSQCGGEPTVGEGSEKGGEKVDDGEVLAAMKAVNQAKFKTQNMNILRQHAMGAHFGVAETGGKFPADLEAVRAAGDIDASVRLTDPNTKEGGLDPIYFANLTPSSPSGSILFAAPFTNADGTRTVALADGAVAHLPESEYQAKVEKQK